MRLGEEEDPCKMMLQLLEGGSCSSGALRCVAVRCVAVGLGGAPVVVCGCRVDRRLRDTVFDFVLAAFWKFLGILRLLFFRKIGFIGLARGQFLLKESLIETNKFYWIVWARQEA